MVSDQALETPAAIFSHITQDPENAVPSNPLTCEEGAELTDFRRYLEERMANLDEIPEDTKIHAMTG